jgi:hypothetical protein
MKLSFVQEIMELFYWPSFFFVMVFWKSLSNWSLAANLDNLVASISLMLAK